MAGAWRIGDALTLSRNLVDDSVDCIVTSPPYWGLRSYLADDDPAKAQEMGAEPTLSEYVERLVVLFRELRRALKPEGTCWLNLGDTYAMTTRGAGGAGKQHTNVGSVMRDRSSAIPDGLKPKDLCLVPYRVALALQADGWYLRSHIIWAKPNPMPESVTDRPTSAHEAVFLLTKSARYHYDAEAVREADSGAAAGNGFCGRQGGTRGLPMSGGRGTDDRWEPGEGRNLRNVWTIIPKPYSGSHYAVMPPKLIEPCIKAGCPVGGLVLDPFGGSGTVGMVAESLGRDWLMFDLDERNAALMAQRTAQRSLLGLMG